MKDLKTFVKHSWPAAQVSPNARPKAKWPTLLTAGNCHAIITAFIAGAGMPDLGFDIEEGPGEVMVWLQRKPNAELICGRLESYLRLLAHTGVTLHVYLREDP